MTLIESYTLGSNQCQLLLLLQFCPGGEGTWVFFGWVCVARDSKLAPRSKKISPKIDTPF